MGLPRRQTRRLLAAMDDAGMVHAALFRKQRHPHGDLLLLRETITAEDAPLAVYIHQDNVFQVNPKQEEIVEKRLAGERQPTQLGGALKELGIHLSWPSRPWPKAGWSGCWGRCWTS